ncbi:MAG: extracellular solute-binding protein [Desulfobacterales bacterium]
MKKASVFIIIPLLLVAASVYVTPVDAKDIDAFCDFTPTGYMNIDGIDVPLGDPVLKALVKDYDIKPGTTVTVIANPSPTVTTMRAFLPAFEKDTGIKVMVEEPASHQIHGKALQDLSSSTGSYDVINMDNPWLPEFVGTGHVMALDGFIKKYESPRNMNDFVSTVFTAYTIVDGKIWGLPHFAAIQILFYRTDLFNDPKIKSAFQKKYGYELAPPKTWKQYNEIARFFTQKFNPDSPTKYGATMCARRKEGAISEICPVLWSFGNDVFDINWRPLLDHPSAIAAVESYLEASKYAPPGFANKIWGEGAVDFMSGEVAMMRMWDALATYVENEDEGSKIKGKVGWALMPGNRPELGGWSWILNKDSKNPAAAYAFMHWSTGKYIAKCSAPGGGFFARVSFLEDAGVNELYPFAPITFKSYALFRRRTDQYAFGPIIVPEDQFENILSTEVNNVVTEQKTPAQAMKDAQGQMTKLMKDFGYLKE